MRIPVDTEILINYSWYSYEFYEPYFGFEITFGKLNESLLCCIIAILNKIIMFIKSDMI